MPTIRSAIDGILAHLPSRGDRPTVDLVVQGDPAQPLTGVAATFMATRAVLEQAVAAGANLVVTHEPTYYNHLDETAWLAGDAVAAAKHDYIERHGLVVWRLHDHVHGPWPDAIARGQLDALGWTAQADAAVDCLVRLPPQPLRDVIDHCKRRLGIASVRFAGDPAMICRGVGFLPGACGGRRQIELLRHPEVDAVVCGESAEWETCEYVRDANAAGIAKALVELGHANSEEAGMRHVADLLRAWLPADTPLVHLPAGDPFAVR